MFQKCPICNGEGRIPDDVWNGNSSAYNTHKTCPTCRGERIISTKNGLPPSMQMVDCCNNDDIIMIDFAGFLKEE